MSDPVAAFLVYFALTLAIVHLTAPPGLARRRIALAIAAGLLIALPLGQAWQHPRALYPFVDWTMYASPVPAPHKEYVAVDARGQTFLYPFALVSFSSPWALMARFDDVIDRCGCAAGDPIADRALQALADVYQADTGTALVRIEAYANWTAGPAARRLAYVWTSPGPAPPRARP